MIARTAVAALAILAVAAPAALSSRPAQPVPIAIVGTTQLTTMESPLVVQDTGTVKGSPITRGQTGAITLTYQLNPKAGRANVTWLITTKGGTISGTCRTDYTTTNTTWTFTGAGRITGGTGAWRGITSMPLQFNAKHSKLGKHEAIAFRGTGSLPARP